MDDSNNGLIKRDEKGRVLPGSRLAAGKWRATSLSEAMKIRTLIEPQREALIERLMALTKGEGAEAVKACEILIGYLAARPRPTAELVNVPRMGAGATLEQKCEAVIDAVAAGQITSTAAKELLSVISDVAQIVHLERVKEKLREAKGELPPKRITAKPEDLV